MKTFLKTFSLALMLATLALVLFAGQARAQDDNGVSFQTFYDQLANQGTWVQTDQYGYVFQPTEKDPNWRPYTYGHWVNTDQGMTWVSDDSFGWATDHYGRWANLDGYGWVWVPGYTWAPAWVSWRDNDDYVGWAPLPPDSDQGIDYYDDDNYFTDYDSGFGFHIGDDCDLAFGIGPWCYNFCPVAFIGDRDCWRHFRDRRDNFALIGRTRNVTNINFRRDGAGRFGRVHADGPSVAALNARARTPIAQARLTSASQLGNAGLRGNTLAVFAPRVDPATARTARPASVGRTLTNTSVNRGTDINRPLAVNSQLRPAGATADQIRAATLAHGTTSANAKIATANTRVSRPLTQPLTSLRTTTRSSSAFGSGVRQNTSVRTPRVSSPSVSAESRFTGESATRHATVPSNPGSAFGRSVRPEVAAPPSASSTYRTTRSYYPGAGSSASSAFRPSTAVYRSQPSVRASAPMFHSSAPAYHPESSFRSFAPAPQPHFGGGNFRGGAPAAHFSGGGFSGGGRSSSGGARAASGGGGGGRSGGNGNGRH